MDVVARLCEGELRPLRLLAADGLHDSAFKSLHERGEGQELVRQQYTGRYPFELLQNANDAAWDAGSRGRVHFLLTETALIVADNGFGFGDEQVNAICSLGRSSKGPGEAVGHKGLGFKSVGEITDHPQITSARASFQFSSERVWTDVSAILGALPAGQKLPVYAFPFPVEAGDFGPDAGRVAELRGDGFTTVIRLPFSEGVGREIVEQHLVDNLHPRLLLFLPNVDHLQLRGTGSNFSAEVSREPEDGVEHVLLATTSDSDDEPDETGEEWFIYRGSVVPDAALLAPLGDAWNSITEARFAVAVPVDDAGLPLVSETFPLHVFFPTDERPGLHVAVHAEWVLTMDRRQVAATPESLGFNRMLVNAVGDFLTASVAPDLVNRTGANAAAVEALVPATVASVGAGGADMRARWIEALLAASFMPAADGQLRTPVQIRPLTQSLPSPERAHQVAELDPGHTLRPDIEERNAVRTFLSHVPGIDEIGVPEFLSSLPPPTRDTVHDYYDFLVAWRERAGSPLVAELRKVPSVLGVNGQNFIPGDGTIFFPRERGVAALPEDLPIPVAYSPATDEAQSLLRDLGVKPFEWRELIRDFLITLLASPETDETTRSRGMAALRAYRLARLSGSEDLEPVLGRVLLPGRTADANMRELRPAALMYFSAPWSGSDDLELIYGAFNEPEFLDVAVPEDSEQRGDELDFFRMLGVTDHPRLDEAKPTEQWGYMVGSGRHPHRGGLFNEWMALPEVDAAARCPQGHPASQQLRRSYQLDRHEQLVESKDPLRLMALWKQLARRWGATYEDGMNAQFWCVNTVHAGERGRLAPSLFAHTLRARSWVPVDRGNVAELVLPMNAWISAAQTPRRIQERIPRISEAMYQAHGGPGLAAALHLTDAGRPRVEDLLTLLGSIADEADAAGGPNRETVQAARWVQRTLHDVLREDLEPHPAPETVRLLATQNGKSSFVAQPPYAEDPLLRDTFEKQRPLLSAEAGLTRLTRYLSLTKLDDAVKTSPLPFGEHHDALYDDTATRVNRIKPYLFALVRAENSSAENRVRPALRSLELIVCDELALRYQYDETEVTRQDAVCYIASRAERRRGRSVNVGTAYLELDPTTRQPHWFPLGRQLAQFLNVPTLSDAFTMLLTATSGDRKRMMDDRQIHDSDVREARQLLRISAEDDEELSNVLDSLVPEPGDEDQREPDEVAVLNQAAAASVTVEPPADDNGEPAEAEQSADVAAVKQAAGPAGPPAVDYSRVEIVDARPGRHAPDAPSRRPSARIGTGGTSTAPSVQTEEQNRRVGKRGEEVAYNAERRRLTEIGKNPASVHWISKTDELSPYDLMSVDEDDQLIYIEVKATRASDPAEPFYISHAELIEATYRRSRYYIYRVTDVDDAAPLITRWADPLALIKEGRGRLLLAKAQMALTVEEDAVE
ncbi:uncharacterized protein DUF3883 [Knoellia remsis]|uniref:Uncharacterized protein DUF3883 n=1 Tax=Knoellia remsis TaxID=407159 RepID=A0A2T0U3N6_9MICO|nr:DUF3883 domain-containing protein [Knoellia remsis]PRY52511.1 uncharacterized protein DUF3883 [Knoellia remsis]